MRSIVEETEGSDDDVSRLFKRVVEAADSSIEERSQNLLGRTDGRMNTDEVREHMQREELKKLTPKSESVQFRPQRKKSSGTIKEHTGKD